MPLDLLSLQGEDLGDEGAAALFAAELPLDVLILRACGLSGDGLDTLPHSTLPLRHLDLSFNPLSRRYEEPDTACRALSAVKLPLKTLHLDGTEIGDAGVGHIARSSLRLTENYPWRHNNVTDVGVRALMTSAQALERLILRDNDIRLQNTQRAPGHPG